MTTHLGESYTPVQRKALEVLEGMGPLRAPELRSRIPTNESGLSRVTARLWPLVQWADDPEVYFIPREYRNEVAKLCSRWQAGL